MAWSTSTHVLAALVQLLLVRSELHNDHDDNSNSDKSNDRDGCIHGSEDNSDNSMNAIVFACSSKW